MRIVMIHGRAQGGKDPDALKADWQKFLQDGFAAAGIPYPARLQPDFPYYAQALDQFVVQASLPTPGDVVAKGAGQNTDFEAFMQQALAEMQGEAGITDDQVAAEMGAVGPQEKGIQNWRWVQAIVRVIDRRLTGVSDFTIESFLQDVYLYVTKPAVTRAINRIVEETLTDQPTIVIGHSLGSVVGYRVILANLARLNLVKYITLGCPLGLKAISGKLGLPNNPGGPQGWYNAYDRRDIVALNPLDDRHFPTTPAIINHGDVNNFTDNRHGIAGYLSDAEVARQLTAALG